MGGSGRIRVSAGGAKHRRREPATGNRKGRHGGRPFPYIPTSRREASQEAGVKIFVASFTFPSKAFRLSPRISVVRSVHSFTAF